MQVTILFFLFQSLFFSPCSGTREKSIRRGDPVTICSEIQNDSGIKYIRLRRSILPIGLFVHYQAILPAQIKPYSASFNIDGIQKDFNGSFVEYTFKPISTWYYNLSVVYTDENGVDQETQQSESTKVNVSP